MKQTVLKRLKKSQAIILIIGITQSAMSNADQTFHGDEQHVISSEAITYSNTVTGSMTLSPFIELMFVADVNCHQTLTPNERYENIQISERNDSIKAPYTVSLEDAEHEAEIMALETGFYYPSFSANQAVEAASTLHTDTAETAKDTKDLLEQLMSTIIRNLVYQQSENQNCSVDNLNVHLLKKPILRAS